MMPVATRDEAAGDARGAVADQRVHYEMDWDTGNKFIADMAAWQHQFDDIRELCVSPDGEKAAAIVNTGEGMFSVCVNGDLWGAEFDKIWHLRFGADGRLSAFVSMMGAWTVATDGAPWSDQFEFLWNLQFARDGRDIVAAAQNDRTYFAVKNGKAWESGFLSLADMSVCPVSGHIAAAVQTAPFREGEIDIFQQGCFSIAVDGMLWDSRFVNAWKTAFAGQGRQVAAEVRTTLYDYTISIDGKNWKNTFQSVWRPAFSPRDGSVTASVRQQGKWFLAKDGDLVWHHPYTQLWHHMYSPDGGRIAAIVARRFGHWTVAIDDRPWKHDFRELVTDAVFSPDGNRLACIGKENGKWTVSVNDCPWDMKADMIWPPLFSPDSATVAARIEKGGKYGVAVDGRLMGTAFDRLWDPVFSPDGRKIRLVGMTDGRITRQVVELENVNYI